MNQQCKVCGEPAAGFHFGAFTCEGCKSFFGRSYNNLTTINDCKNNGTCVINKKNRTSCKACRLNKCLKVGMSKSGSRYGRRSNWFKIHCLLQEQQQNANLNLASFQLPTPSHNRFSSSSGGVTGSGGGIGGSGNNTNRNRHSPTSNANPSSNSAPTSSSHHHQQLQLAQIQHHQNHSLSPLTSLNHFPPSFINLPRIKEELMLLNIDEANRKSTVSPSIGSPESHHSDSSSVDDLSKRSLASNLPPLFSNLFSSAAAFLPPPNFLFQAGFPAFYPNLIQQTASSNNNNNSNQNNNNNKLIRNNNMMNTSSHQMGNCSGLDKRLFLDAILQSQKSPQNIRSDSNQDDDDDDNENDDDVDDDNGDDADDGDDDNNNKAKQAPSTTITKLVKGEIATDNLRCATNRVAVDDDHPMDLSMKSSHGGSERHSSPIGSVRSLNSNSDLNNSDCSNSENDLDVKKIKLERIPTPLDLTTKV